MAKYASEKSYPTHAVGELEFSEYHWEDIPDSYDWLVYSYTREDWRGEGHAIAKIAGRDEYDVANLRHCSCYGPTENWCEDRLDREGILKHLDHDGILARSSLDFDAAHWQALRPKVLELLGMADGQVS